MEIWQALAWMEPEQLVDVARHILAEFEGQKGAVIPILQRIQDAYGYLPKEIMAVTSRKTKIPLSQLFGVATFYAQFRLKRRGRHLIRVCDGTACHVRGAPRVVEEFERELGVRPVTLQELPSSGRLRT